MTTKKKLFLTFLALSVTALGAYIFYLDYTGNMKEYYGAYDTYTGQFEIDDYAFIDKGHAVVTHFKQKQTKDLAKMKKYGKRSVLKKSSPRPIVTSSDYLILLTANLKGNSGSYPYSRPDHLKRKKGETRDLVIYKREGDHLRKSTLNLFDLQSSVNNTIGVNETLVRLNNGHVGLSITLGWFKSAYLDLITHKVVDKSSYHSTITSFGGNISRNIVYSGTGKNRVNRYADVGLLGGVYAFPFEANKLKSQETHLSIASQYPEAYQLLLKDNSYLSMMADDTKSNVKAYASVLGLFNKDGEAGVFKDLTISEFYTVDKQEHTVNSYEEFMRYYNFSS
ncbi:hypothetical protein ACVR0S_07785 [Streptococcus dentapri]|uniref:Lipoprotein n=1 Tax=Streptococcus dentapri TaxID=573564 RepID=A0ABV8D001_9STRE